MVLFILRFQHEMSDSSQHLRIALTVIHLMLVGLGSLNVFVIFLILSRPYLRSITNVYMVGLCLADFIYLTDLSLVAATSLNMKSWPFGSVLCHFYHGTETTALFELIECTSDLAMVPDDLEKIESVLLSPNTSGTNSPTLVKWKIGKYASVLFVVLLAADRYLAMCTTDICARYRNYRVAMILSTFAWLTAIICSLPLYLYAKEATFGIRPKNSSGEQTNKTFCLVHWPSTPAAQWYITSCSVLIFIIPVLIIFYCYYKVFCKLREAVKGSRRLHRSTARAPYQRVTRNVQRVVLFHLVCWTPFWLFNLFSSIFRVRITSQLERIVVNIIHLFPYVNCALNPLLYAYRAENFRIAFKSMFLVTSSQAPDDDAHKVTLIPTNKLHSSQYELTLSQTGDETVRTSTPQSSLQQSVIDNSSPRCSLQLLKNEKSQPKQNLHVQFSLQETDPESTALTAEEEQDSITLL
ncbi:hypothetical protein KIN20_028912 [Parelaphostrongylus tenuis]|uniref:G-protein coupled receptors family 1 profile domain-containing protein n=1 Tax=Parelaphostrongylus tenuis TaxID=148309 RepID=A0AAD5R1Q2_PARTN|nr:hypothetical protein KIN20_028912 [Parelaphostrongylus tenuis]